MPRRKPADLTPLPEHVVTHPAMLVACLEHLAAAGEVAFDTEFVGEDTYRPDLCLVQVATAERLYLIDPFSAGPLDAFWELLTDPARTVIVHAGREEVRMCRAGVGRPPATLVDVQIASALVGYPYPIGYAALVQDVLRVHAKKGETLTDWRRRPLSPAQVRYAFDDVRYLIPAWHRLADRLRRLGREDWLAEECAAFVRRAVADDPAVERWRKIKGAGSLDRRGLAVLRELYAWREAVAGRVNRPARTVLRDDLMIEIARRGPATADALGRLRGVPRGEVPAILDAVHRANALPPEACPEPDERESDPPHVTLLASLLGVVLSEACARSELGVSIVATSQDLKNLVRARQPGGALPENFPLARGWRRTAVLAELQAFLDGRRVLRVEDPAARHPIRIDAPGEHPSK
jgi:ribonuclease D